MMLNFAGKEFSFWNPQTTGMWIITLDCLMHKYFAVYLHVEGAECVCADITCRGLCTDCMLNGSSVHVGNL